MVASVLGLPSRLVGAARCFPTRRATSTRRDSQGACSLLLDRRLVGKVVVFTLLVGLLIFDLLEGKYWLRFFNVI